MRNRPLYSGAIRGERDEYRRASPALLAGAINSWRQGMHAVNSNQTCGQKWFSHSGDLGDIIYSLPAIRAAGGAKLYLCPGPGTNAIMSAQRADLILPLLRAQPYVHGAEFVSECRPSSLNSFRHYLWQPLTRSKTLIDAHFDALGISPVRPSTKWLEVDPIVGEFPVLCARSPRYQNPAFSWRRVVDRYRARAAFVGLAEEHKAFCDAFGELPFLQPADLMELARHIAGAKLFIGNQSCPMAIAHGLHVSAIMEVATGINDNCRIIRSNSIFAIDDMFELPEIM